MCVAVTLDPGADLTLEEVERMNRANADGVGIAWARKGVVQWFKTTKVDPKYVVEMVQAWKAHPRLVHFRFATAGGTRPDLCHPFEIGPLANCKTTGTSAKVMIHNGHWSKWDEVHKLLSKEHLLPDNGPWSDTRLAAYLAHHDPEWLTALGGKVAVMTGSGEISRIGSWEKLRDGIKVSNTNWNLQGSYQRGGYAGYRSWRGWQWDEDEYEAYFKDKEAEAEAIEAELKKLDAEVEAAIVKDEHAKSKKERKRERAERRRAAVLAGNLRSTGDASDAPTPALGTPHVGAAANSTVSCAVDCAPGGKTDDGKRYAEGPFQAENGKWYRVVTIRGSREVVETIAPRA